MTAPDGLVRIEVLALGLGISMNHTRRAYLKGQIPPPDEVANKSFSRHPALCWRLATLHAHDPELARRCAALLAVAALMPRYRLLKTA